MRKSGLRVYKVSDKRVYKVSDKRIQSFGQAYTKFRTSPVIGQALLLVHDTQFLVYLSIGSGQKIARYWTKNRRLREDYFLYIACSYSVIFMPVILLLFFCSS